MQRGTKKVREDSIYVKRLIRTPDLKHPQQASLPCFKPNQLTLEGNCVKITMSFVFLCFMKYDLT